MLWAAVCVGIFVARTVAAGVVPLPICAPLQVGVTVNGTEVITLGTGHDFDQFYTFATYAKTFGTMYMSLATGYPSTFSIMARPMPDPSVDDAGCQPTVMPSSGIVGSTVVPFNITYNCQAIGRTRIYLGINLNSSCLSNAVWNKFSGTALVVATSQELLDTPDVVNLGQTLPQWTQASTVYSSVGNLPGVFFMRISHHFNRTAQPSAGLVAVSNPNYLSLSPLLTPNASLPYTPGSVMQLSVEFGCSNSEDGGAVTVTLLTSPFAPSTFQFFKQCHNVPAFAVDNVDASGGSVYKVIRDGEVLDPAFGPAPSYVFDLNTNVSFFKAWLSSDPYVKSYTTTATVVTAVNAYNPFDGACSYSVSGALSNSGVLAGTPATLNITYDCGNLNGMTLFTANITVTNLVLGANPPRNSVPIVFYWLKACGSTPGLDVTFIGPADYRNGTSVLRDGRPVAGWLPPPESSTPLPSDPSYAFLPMSVEFLRFSFVQSAPYPPDVLNGKIVVNLVNTDINPVDPQASGPLSGSNPVISNTPQELWIDLYPKSTSLYTGVVVSPQILSFTMPSFGFYVNVSLDENLQLNCLNWGNVPVVSGGLVDNHWPNYSPIHRPVLELDFVLLQLKYHVGDSYVGTPYARSNVSEACSVNFTLVGATAPVHISSSTGSVNLKANFDCKPLIGNVLLTFIVPLVTPDGSQAAYTPFKFSIVFDTDTNPPSVPGITTTLALSPLSPLSSNITTNFTAGAVLTFQAPDDYFDTISTYVVRTFDITAPVNVSGNNFTEAAYPAPSSNPLAIPLVFPDYRHVYGVELAAVNIVGRGNFSEMVTSSYSMSPSPTVSPSWSATQSVSVSQEPAALVHKNNLNHDIAIASFTVFGVAAAGLVVFALLRWRMQRKQASVIQPFDDLSKYEPPQVTPGATAPPEPDRDSDGSGNPPIRPAGKSIRSSQSKSKRLKMERVKKTDQIFQNFIEANSDGMHTEEGDYIPKGVSIRSSGSSRRSSPRKSVRSNRVAPTAPSPSHLGAVVEAPLWPSYEVDPVVTPSTQ